MPDPLDYFLAITRPPQNAESQSDRMGTTTPPFVEIAAICTASTIEPIDRIPYRVITSKNTRLFGPGGSMSDEISCRHGGVLRERAAADPRRWSYEIIGYKKRQNSKGHKKAAGPKPRRRSLDRSFV